MGDKIKSLITEDGKWLPVGKRTAAVIAEVHDRREEIEKCDRGTIEILINVKDSSVSSTLTVRKVGESRKIE